MKARTTLIAAAAGTLVVSSLVLFSPFARASGKTLQGRTITAVSGFVANPVFDEKGGHGENPFYESKLRMTMGGGGSGGNAYSVDITIHVEFWDGKEWRITNNVIHRDLAARNLLLARTVDVISVPEGVAVSFDRGPRQTVSLDGDYSSRRISTNVTIVRQTPQTSFGNRMVVQSFGPPDGDPGAFVSIPLE